MNSVLSDAAHIVNDEHHTPTKQTTAALVADIKHAEQDFEWYPTTDEILTIIKNDIDEDDHPSILDCGAGDGRSLLFLTKGKRYAIEKSQPLLQSMDKSIYIVGTEFQEQTLIDKKVDVVFCNPPYSEFIEWTSKLIRECHCSTLYLVIPIRWQENPTIKALLEQRRASAEVLGTFDFLDAHRCARAQVDIVRVSLGYEDRYARGGAKIDPFDLWFDEEFNLDINNTSSSKHEWERRKSSKRHCKTSSWKVMTL